MVVPVQIGRESVDGSPEGAVNVDRTPAVARTPVCWRSLGPCRTHLYAAQPAHVVGRMDQAKVRDQVTYTAPVRKHRDECRGREI